MSNGMVIPVIKRIITGDGARHEFVYNSWGQVNEIATYGEADNKRSVMFYAFPSTGTPQSDCPLFTQRNDYIANWAGSNATPGWVATYFYVAPDESYGQIGYPNGVVYKEFHGNLNDHERGLLKRTETLEGSARRQFTVYNWQSDGAAGVFPPIRPRIIETKVCDDRNSNNTYQGGTDKMRRTTISYVQLPNLMYTTIRLPEYIREHNEGDTGSSAYRTRKLSYLSNTEYISGSRRIVGLVSQDCLYSGDVGTLIARTDYNYDYNTTESGFVFLQDHSGAVSQHEGASTNTAYQTGGQPRRGNLTKAMRYSVDSNGSPSMPIVYKTGYHSTGTVACSTDGIDTHKTSVFYNDSFTHGYMTAPSPATYAYPTRVQDPDNFSSMVKYHYDHGGVTEAIDPKSYAGTQTTKVVTLYDTKGRVERTVVVKDGAPYSYSRNVYSNDHNWMQTLATVRVSPPAINQNASEETFVLHLLDGASRERITISEHPGSMGTLKSQYVVYDFMGRINESSNPTEVNGYWAPAGLDAAGYSVMRYEYDWKGRSTVTYNQDYHATNNPASKRTVSYGGCGCAGALTVTSTDEVGRKTVSSYDIFGRMEKMDTYKANGNDICLTETYQYDVRNLRTERKVTDPAPNTYRIWPTMYDGYGRVWKEKAPEDEAYSEFDYYTDNTLKSKKDPRGVVTDYQYFNRPLVKEVKYTLPASPTAPILASNCLLFEYDENGKRKKMTEKPDLVAATPAWAETTYNYDTINRMTSEVKFFKDVADTNNNPYTFSLTYSYNQANEPVGLDFVSSRSGVDNFSFTHNYDKTGRVIGVAANPQSANPTLLSGVEYTAWGGWKKAVHSHGGSTTNEFTNRMQYSSYKLTTPHNATGILERMKSNYGYYLDGRLKTVETTENTNFDRGYTYDDVGRVKDAFTSNDATNFRVYNIPPTPPGQFDQDPYYQSSTYNVWGQITQRSGKVWNVDDNRTQSYGTDGRRVGISYDKAGNITNDATNTYDYDAAGRSVRLKAVGSTDTSRNWHDGDGRVVCSNPYPAKKELWIRSSVLNGAVIAAVQGGTPGTNNYYKYAPLGAVIDQNYFAGDQLIVQDTYTYPNNNGQRDYSRSWRHLKPLIGTEAMVNSGLGFTTYTFTKIAERNADGLNVGLVNPAQQPTNSPDYELPTVSSLPGGQQPVILIDGQPVELHLAHAFLRLGAAEIDWKQTSLLTAIQLGVFGHWEPEQVMEGKERIFSGRYVFNIDFIRQQSGGQKSGGQQGDGQQTPCASVIPTDPNARAVWNTLIGESEQVQTALPANKVNTPGTGHYGPDQAGKEAYKSPNSGLVGWTDVYQGMILMVDVIQNRLTDERRFRGKSWSDVVTATYAEDGKTKNEFEGYPTGAGYTQATLGNEGDEPCIRSYQANNALWHYKAFGVTNRNIHNWRGIKQGEWIRPISGTKSNPTPGAIRVANTDFY